METPKQQFNSWSGGRSSTCGNANRALDPLRLDGPAGPSESRWSACTAGCSPAPGGRDSWTRWSLGAWSPRRPCPASGGSVRRAQRPWGRPRPQKTPDMGADGHRRPSSPPPGLKPIAHQVRRMLPFGSPKCGRVAGPNEAKRRRRRVVQFDPPHGGTDARFPRRGRWRGSVAAPAPRVHGPPGIAGLHPAAGRASRGPLNGFPGAFAGVLRHPNGGGRRRVSDTSATGSSDAAKAGEPAYSLGPHSVRPLRRLAGGCAPSDPYFANGAS